MKRVFALSSIILLISAGICGCKKNDNSNGSWSATVNNTVTRGAYINASYFSANGKLIVTLTPSAAVVYPAIVLQGITDSAGTVTLDSSSAVTGTFTDSASAVVYSTASGGSGQFVISTFTPFSSKIIGGSFNFIAHNPINFADSVVITNGSFSNVGLIVQ